MSTNIKPKELSQAHARGIAHDLLAGLAPDGAWQSALQEFEALSPGQRKTVVDALREAVSGATKVEAARFAEFALAAIRPGRTTDFALSLVQVVLELCAALGEQASTAPATVLAALLLSEADAKKEGLPYGAELDVARLGKSRGVGSALSDLIENGRCDALLKGSIPVWGRLIAGLVAFRGPACGIRPAAAKIALSLISDPSVTLPVEVALSASWLCEIAGSVPDALVGRFPAVRRRDGSSRESPAPTTTDLPSPPIATPRAQLLDAIDGLLKRFETEVEQRRSVLSNEATRLAAVLKAREDDLEKERSVVFELQRDLSHARQKMEALKAEANNFSSERQTLEDEVAKWKKESEVLLDSRGNQIEQAKSECRREFAKAAMANLKNLRGFVLELKGADKSSTGALAATALDEVIRVLHRQQFTTADELPRLQ